MTNDSSPSDAVASVVARARAAQVAWAALTPDERVKKLAPLADRVLERAEAITACVHGEVGKPDVEVLLGEVLPSADVVKYWTRVVAELLDPVEIEIDPLSYPGKKGTIQ